MAAVNRNAHRDYVYRTQMKNDFPDRMTEYQHSDRETNGNLTPGDSRRPQGDFSRPQRAEGGEPSFRVAVTMKKDNGHTSKEWELVDTEGRPPTGQFRAKPVQVDYLDNQIGMDQVDAKMDGYERQRLEAETRKLARERSDLYWREGEPSEKRSPQHQPHRRHNTSPDHRHFVSAKGVMIQGQTAKTAALTTENLKRFENSERQKELQAKQIRRSFSNSSLDKRQDAPVNVVRDFGSTSSIDVHSIGGDSFFQMVQDFRTETDQRSPAPPHFDKLLQGKLTNGTEDERTNTMSSNKSDYAKEDNKVSEKGNASPRLHRRMPSKREKKNRSKTYSGAEVSLLRRLRSTKGDSGAKTPEGRMDDDLLEARIEEGVKRRAFLHYDVQSVYFDLPDIIRIVQNPERKRSTLTGASAASSRQQPNTPSGSIEDLTAEEQDLGDGRSNDLLLSCPFFRNELGEEAEPRVSLSKMGTLNTKVMRKFKHRVILERIGDGRGIANNPKGPILELVDHGALYYRQYFEKHEHQNYFGIDNILGPVALSVRREKLNSPENPLSDNGKDSTARYLYRIILRTSELNTLRGYIMEDSIPSSAKHNTSRGLPLRDVLEYVVPDLPLTCLKVANNSEKTREHLCKLDEQGLSNKYKIGILYCRAGQGTEEEMYNNEHSGPAFDEFLECVGEKVKLKGFVKYRAQLDNRTDSTGPHSIYAVYQGNEIMFHVSTMLPYTPNNRQQLPRKRHVGNDIVTIIFQEPGSLPFTPKSVRSHFQHIFIVIRAHEPNTDDVHYSVAVSRSKDVPVFGPPLPPDAIFAKSSAFADFIIAKAINAENAVHKTEKFVAMATRTRKEYLKDLAMNHVTNSTIDPGGKFSLFNKKKEKSCPRPAPDFRAKGALVWDIMVYLWAPITKGSHLHLQMEDYSLADPVSCFLGISPDMIVLLKTESRETLFSIPCKAVIGWTPQPHSLKLYFNEGNCIRMRINDHDLDEIPEIVKRLEAVTTGTKTQEITLRRNGLGQLGFHVHFQGIVVEVDPYGYTWQAGLRKGARLVEICEIAVCTQTHEEMIDLLRTSMTVKVSVVPPYADGSPRRGTTPMEYISSDEDVHNMRPAFTRSRSTGRGPTKVYNTFHATSREPAPSGTGKSSPSSYPYPPTVNDEGLPNPGNVRVAIQTFERKISIDDQPENRQRKYRHAVNYWQNLDDQGDTGGVRMESHLGGRAENVDRSLMRLAQERRSVREGHRSPQRPKDLPLRMRSSQEELDKIASRNHSRENSFEGDYRSRAFTDNSARSAPKKEKKYYHQSQSSVSSQSSQNQFVSTTPQYKRANVAQATIKLTGSRDALHLNNSNDKWYDSKDDDYERFHDNTVSVSKDILPENYMQSSNKQQSMSAPRSSHKERTNYARAERYSPTEHLYKPKTLDYEHMAPSHSPMTETPKPHQHAHSSSNLSELSLATISTHSSGSIPRDLAGEVRSQHGSTKRHSPRTTPVSDPRGKHTPSPTTPTPAPGTKDYQYPRRPGPSVSSSSSMSDSSPRSSKRRGADGRNASNESLNSRLRPGVTAAVVSPGQGTKVQEDLKKLIAPEDNSASRRHDPYTAARPPPYPSSRNANLLNRTLSDESISAGGGGGVGGSHTQPMKKGNGGSNRGSGYSDSRNFSSSQSSTLPSKTIPESRNRGSKYSRISPEGAAAPALAATFPLPDSTTSLDWKNLVETAQMFEDHQAYRSVSADTLNELDDNTPTISGLSQTPDKRMSKSSGSISRPPQQGRARSMSQREPDKGRTADNPSGKSKHELEQELQKLQEELQQERQFKDSMQQKLHKLFQAQGREAVIGSAENIQEFKEWYFSGYDK
ncbi:uncharacterized protein [Apostichopus japonicus]|uniref:uncharacterized protein isoform X4 n=1 Tax=Stichopus japonicus TaxID=307972 RepID=UPI003AB5FCBA